MQQRFWSRRQLLNRVGGGFAGLAANDLLHGASLMSPRQPHFPAKAKAVISIFCYGGVSQVDTFDPKPALLKYQGETMTGVGEVRATMGTQPLRIVLRLRRHPGQPGHTLTDERREAAVAAIRLLGHASVDEIERDLAPSARVNQIRPDFCFHE